MYSPGINHVLVQIDDKGAKWGKSSDNNIGGDAYREGKVRAIGLIFATADHPLPEKMSDLQLISDTINDYVGATVMWNEGHEAGTVFVHEGKKYALIYWWDIIGVKDDTEKK